MGTKRFHRLRNPKTQNKFTNFKYSLDINAIITFYSYYYYYFFFNFLYY